MSDHDDNLRPPRSRSERRIQRGVVRPLQEFLATSAASATLLFGAAAIALVWANLGDSYEAIWTTPLPLGTDLRFWVNEGLMTLFFLVAGIEIKRELTVGELRRPRAAALPVLAAVGGMVAPALLFLAVVRGGEGAYGWGIPMATDIALALGALALAASRAPSGLKPLLLTLAIVDDIGAILVIALFYSHGVQLGALTAAVAIVLAIVALERVHVRFPLVYVGLAPALWVATYRAGIHPTLAGVVLGLLIPARPLQPSAAVGPAAEAVSPMARIEHVLLPWTSFVVVPLFALANAGVPLSATALAAATSSAVAWGVVAGLVVGKPLGIWLAARAATATGVGELPIDVGRRDLLGLGATAGIGFTVALFIAELAFEDRPDLVDEAVIAILVGSIVAGMVGQVVLRAGRRPA